MDDEREGTQYRSSAIKAAGAFGIECASVDLVDVSENVTFRVTDSRQQRYVVRLHRPGYHTLERLESESLWLEALRNFGVSVPHPVRARDGHHHVEVPVGDGGDFRFAGVSKWVDGDVVEGLLPSDPEPAEVAGYFSQLGTIMATMHNQASGWSPPAGFDRHRVDADGFLGDEPFWGRFWDAPGFSSAERDLLIETRDELRGVLGQYGQAPQTFSMIHADLHLGNLLVSGGQLSVIDFDDAAFGWHQYDLAVAMFDTRSMPYGEVAEAALFDGYRAAREISVDDLALVPMFELIRGMALIGWKNQRPEVDWTSDRFEDLKQEVLESCRHQPWRR